MGLRQESKAEASLAALEKMMKNIARVRRDGEAVEIEAEQLVPGDIVLMEAGNRVPADGRLFVTATLEIEEAALTGESVASPKDTETIDKAEVALGDRHCMAYMNTSVTRGRGEMIVTTTGMGTEMGHIADLLNKTEADKTPLQKQLDRLTIDHRRPRRRRLHPDGDHGPERRRIVRRRCSSPASRWRSRPSPPAARRRDHPVLDGDTSAGQPERHRQAAAVGGDAGLGLGDLLRQDRHADAEQDDGARVHDSRAEPLQGDGRGLQHPGTTARTSGGAKIDLDEILVPMALVRRCAATPFDGENLIGDPTEGALIVLAEKGGINVEGARRDVSRAWPRCRSTRTTSSWPPSTT